MFTAKLAPAVALAALVIASLRAIAENGATQDGNTNAVAEPKSPTLEELEKLPTGLKVVHDPSPVLATRTANADTRCEYKWYYKTTVTAIDDDVTIDVFGAFVLIDGEWVEGGSITGKPYGAAEFAEWYKSENAKIPKGKSFADATNWSGGNELQAQKFRWYYVGRDSKGRRIKGEAIVEHKPEIDPKRPMDPEPDERE